MTSRPRSARSSLLIAIAVLVALALGPVSARQPATATAAEQAGLTLEPDHGQPGDELVLRGTDFPADAAGEVRLALDDSRQADVRTDAAGVFEVPLVIPALAPGTYDFTVVVEAATEEGAAPDDSAGAEGDPTVTFTVDEPPVPTEAPPTETATEAPPAEIAATDTATPTAAPPTETPTEVTAATPVETPDATPEGSGTPTAVATPTDEPVGGAGAPATLTLSKDKSKFNGYVTATVIGLAPNSSTTLRWPRAYEITTGPDAGELTTLLDTATTDGTGRATFGFRTPLEPFGDYVVTARDRSGGKATDTLRVIPRIALNEEEGPVTTRLRVYFYGFGPGERIETRWHATGSVTSGYVVLKTLTVAANGRASSIVTIPRSAIFGAHQIVGKVVGVSRSASTPFTLMRSTESATVLAVADIAACNSTGDEEVAAVVAGQPGTLLVAGDIAYERGTAQQFADCYDPAWGPFKDRTKPSPGNHEYGTPNATGYFDYFGAAAGDPAKGYYSFDLGAWHVVSLNSNCAAIGGCGEGSAQEQWLRADLAANPADCTLAYFHHPLFSSGEHGNDPRMKAIWQVLYDSDADLILSGHDHHYERFAPQDPQGAVDPVQGIREFVVGMGGRSHYAVEAVEPNSEVHSDDTYGVLKLVLEPTGYSWNFLPVAGGTFADSGTTSCHDGNGAIADNSGNVLAASPRPGVATRGDGPGWPLRELAAAWVSLADRRARPLG